MRAIDAWEDLKRPVDVHNDRIDVIVDPFSYFRATWKYSVVFSMIPVVLIVQQMFNHATVAPVRVITATAMFLLPWLVQAVGLFLLLRSRAHVVVDAQVQKIILEDVLVCNDKFVSRCKRWTGSISFDDLQSVRIDSNGFGMQRVRIKTTHGSVRLGFAMCNVREAYAILSHHVQSRTCGECGYDLRGTNSNVCPECGTRRP